MAATTCRPSRQDAASPACSYCEIDGEETGIVNHIAQIDMKDVFVLLRKHCLQNPTKARWSSVIFSPLCKSLSGSALVSEDKQKLKLHEDLMAVLHGEILRCIKQVEALYLRIEKEGKNFKDGQKKIDVRAACQCCLTFVLWS